MIFNLNDWMLALYKILHVSMFWIVSENLHCIQLYLLFTLSFDFRIGRHFLSKVEFLCMDDCVVLISLERWTIFFTCCNRRTDGKEEGASEVKKEDRSCIEGYFWGCGHQIRFIWTLLQSFVGDFGLSAAKTCLLWLQKWTSEGQEVKVSIL